MKNMKKKILSILSVAILFIAFSISGCKKDTTTTFSEQPFSALFADDVLSDISKNDTFINDSYYEFGFEFEVTKNGKITQLGTKNPDAGNIRVSIWDLTDTSVIAQSSISAVAHTPKFLTLPTAVSLTTGKKYAITMLSNDYYWRERTAGAIYTYPITKGNIKITKYGYRFGNNTPALYPVTFPNYYIAGIADFTYETE